MGDFSIRKRYNICMCMYVYVVCAHTYIYVHLCVWVYIVLSNEQFLDFNYYSHLKIKILDDKFLKFLYDFRYYFYYLKLNFTQTW